ncbi:MAG: hypothetical protein ABW022_07535 [Actinoplanes sp.]
MSTMALYRYVADRDELELLVADCRKHLGPLAVPGTWTMAALPADEFPLMRAPAGDATRVEAADEFLRGLDIVLRGLATRPRL